MRGIAVAILVQLSLNAWAARSTDELEARKVSDIFEFRSGVIVDSKERTVYLMNPEHGIDAIDLSSGELLWRTTDAAKPLLLHEHRLIAQAESGASRMELPIVILDTRNAGTTLSEAAVPLPEGVQAMIDEGLGTAFDTSARVFGEDMILSWQYSQRGIGGARAAPDSGPRIASGHARIDLHTGTVKPLEPHQVPPVSPIDLPDRVERAIAREKLPRRLWQSGNVLALVVRGVDDGQHHAVLRRWHSDTGEPMPDVVVSSDEFTYRYVSADGRHILASRRAGTTSPAWTWRLYALETGTRVAEVGNDSPGARFFATPTGLVFEAPPTGRIASGELVVDEPPRLRAIDLDSGGLLWEQPLRDTAYRGPHPPAGGDSDRPN